MEQELNRNGTGTEQERNRNGTGTEWEQVRNRMGTERKQSGNGAETERKRSGNGAETERKRNTEIQLIKNTQLGKFLLSPISVLTFSKCSFNTWSEQEREQLFCFVASLLSLCQRLVEGYFLESNKHITSCFKFPRRL
jgi:hypothetical protein